MKKSWKRIAKEMAEEIDELKDRLAQLTDSVENSVERQEIVKQIAQWKELAESEFKEWEESFFTQREMYKNILNQLLKK